MPLFKKPIKAIVIGAGNRGNTYADYAIHFPKKFQIVGVADPREFQRKKQQKLHNIPDKQTFTDWKEVIKLDKFADCVIIATPDRLHKEPAVAFARKGYHILLEKPMSVTAEDCKEICQVVKENKVYLVVCHVLRYIAWAKKIKEIIESGVLGDIVNIQHTEPVGFWHFAHSYVRGNWHKESTSSISLLAKCCHDVDLISYWMGDLKCEKVSSFGHLSHFNLKNKVGFWHFAHSFVRGNWHKESTSANSLLAKCCHDVDLIQYWMGDLLCEKISSFGQLSHFNLQNKPEGAASRCLDCPTNIETKCPYSAKRLYLDFVKSGHTRWPVNVLTDIPDIENVTQALRTGPYGKCVYQNDNDVMSQQIVNFQFTGGATATLTMMAFTKNICARATNIYGTKGQLKFDDGKSDIVEVCDFLTGQTYSHQCTVNAPVLSRHGGADFFIMEHFVDSLLNGVKDDELFKGVDQTLQSHLLVFAAEVARKENRIITVNPDGTYH